MAADYELEDGSGTLFLEDGFSYLLDGIPPDVWWAYSDDDGRTWSTAEVVVTDTHSGTGNASLFDGLRVIAALRYVSGSSAPCNIVGVRMTAGTNTPSSEFTFKDSAAADIEFEDESFHIFPAYDGSARWILTAKAFGATEVSEWQSFDRCATWEAIV